LLKNAHLRRCPYPSSLRRTSMYASLLGVSGALYLNVFEQPENRAEAFSEERSTGVELGSLVTYNSFTMRGWMEKVYSKEGWIEALRGLGSRCRVYVPVKEGDFHVFRELEGGKKPDFGYQNSRLSAKGVVYPQSERMMECILDEREAGGNVYQEAAKEYGMQVIAGVRPCDAHGFQIVKVNFDNAEYRDPWWVKRFETSILVGLGCNEPCSTCFCTSVGGGPFSEKGLDVLVYDLGEEFMVKGLTERGEALMGELEGGKAVGEGDRGRMEQVSREASRKMHSSIATDRLKGQEMKRLFEAPFWEEVAFACINCGTCTYLCPTCWCFDIQDEVVGKEGDRMRNWDSCMFPLFSLHGSGHNPREKKHQRVRQRFMHKLKYYVDKYDRGVQCSGCGRCVRYCPVNIDIRRVAERMNSY
jgi:sulfhydrogenase subunit beta (sulfur reductase)